MPQGSQEGLDINAAVVAQEGLDTLAAQNDATEGQVPTVGSDGKVAFAAGGGGGVTPPVLIAGTDPDSGSVPLTVVGAPGQANEIFVVQSFDGNTLIEVDGDGADAGGFLTIATPSQIEVTAIGRLKLQSGGSRVEVIAATGIIFYPPNSAPDDAIIGDGGFALWLDSTAGAPALHVKAKDSLGAVYTATIPLTVAP